MQDFFGWASSRMTTEYISTSKAAVVNFANKLQQTELVQKPHTSNEIDVKSNMKVDENNTGEGKSEICQNCSSTRAPMKIESGGKVFYINHIENFTC